VCGSSSWLVQVTVLPALTVNVAGVKAELSMLTWLPATAAGDPVGEAVPVGAPGIDGIPLMPGIPGVPLAFDPKITDGCALGREPEHPATKTAPAANTAPRCLRSMTMFMPEDKAAGYTTYAGWSGCAGANTSMTPLPSRTINAGNGFGAIGNWWVSTCPLGENDVE
jgi:hypothetical protein